MQATLFIFYFFHFQTITPWIANTAQTHHSPPCAATDVWRCTFSAWSDAICHTFALSLVASQLCYLLKTVQYEVQRNVELNETKHWVTSQPPIQGFVLPVWLLIWFKSVGIIAHHRKLHSESLDAWLLPQHVGRVNFQHRPKLSKNYRSWPVVFTYLDGFVVCLSTKSRNETANVFRHTCWPIDMHQWKTRPT